LLLWQIVGVDIVTGIPYLKAAIKEEGELLVGRSPKLPNYSCFSST